MDHWTPVPRHQLSPERVCVLWIALRNGKQLYEKGSSHVFIIVRVFDLPSPLKIKVNTLPVLLLKFDLPCENETIERWVATEFFNFKFQYGAFG